MCRTGQTRRRAAHKISGYQQSYQRSADANAIARRDYLKICQSLPSDSRVESRSGAHLAAGRSPSSAPFAFQQEHIPITVPDFDIVILNALLCEMNGMTIVSAYKFF